MSDPDRYKSRGRKERTPEQLEVLEMAREKARLAIAVAVVVRSKLERGGRLFPMLESGTTKISDEIIALPVQCVAVLMAVDALGVEHSAATSHFDVLPQSFVGGDPSRNLHRLDALLLPSQEAVQRVEMVTDLPIERRPEREQKVIRVVRTSVRRRDDVKHVAIRDVDPAVLQKLAIRSPGHELAFSADRELLYLLAHRGHVFLR